MNPFSTELPWSLVSDGYEKTSRLFLGQFSQTALEFAKLKPTSKVLDVACGPGTLTRLIAHQVDSVTALDFSEPMIQILRKHLQKQNISNVETIIGDGQNLLFQDQSFDAAFSMFGLMFFPDRIRGFSEMFRVLKPGGIAIVSSWAPVSQSPAMQMMFGAMQAGKSETPKSTGTAVTNLEDPKIFEDEMSQAGFLDIRIELVKHNVEAVTIQSFWDFMVLGSAPIVLMKQNMSEMEWDLLQNKALDYLKTNIKQVPVKLSSSAWIGVGIKK